MLFHDREEAAERLAHQLHRYRGKRPLVLGVPRGGVPMASILADRLGGDLDIVLVRKLRSPFQEELAIGAVDEQGIATIASWAQLAGAKPDYLEHETAQQLDLIRRRRSLYTPEREAYPLKGREVIVVDDGIATGSTLMAALRSVRHAEPARLIAAIGVAPPTPCARSNRSRTKPSVRTPRTTLSPLASSSKTSPVSRTKRS